MLALPALFRLALPSSEDPEKKSTVPVGMPAVEVTVAVIVTACPRLDGLGVDDTVVVVVAVAEFTV
jgi:hypothetical protein